MKTQGKRPRSVWVRRMALAGAAFATAAVTVSSVASAYPPAPPEASLAVVVDTVCDGDVPFIEYTITPVGFASAGPAMLTITDVDGQLVDTIESSTLSGRILFPGAAVDENGTGTDYPGFELVDGEWIEDPSDARLRAGVGIEFEVNPTATGFASYPDATEECAGPAVRSVASGGVTNQASLPQTGNSGLSSTLMIAGLALAAGGVLLIGTAVSGRRRARVESA